MFFGTMNTEEIKILWGSVVRKKIKSEKVFVTIKTCLSLDRWVCNRCCIKELRCILIKIRSDRIWYENVLKLVLRRGVGSVCKYEMYER